MEPPVNDGDPPFVALSTLRGVACGGEELELASSIFLFHVTQQEAGEEGEHAPPPPVLRPKSLDEWLGELDTELRGTLRAATDVALHMHYDKRTKLMDWARARLPAQAVLVAAQVAWARDARDALHVLGPMPRALESVTKQIAAQLHELAAVSGSAEPGRASRHVLHALLVAGARFQDVLAELQARGVGSSDDFEWQRHLRYEVHSGEVTVAFPDGGLHPYAFEYDGMATQMDTVGSDAMELSLASLHMGAQLGHGSLLAGPVQAGKTESVRALGRLLGRRVYLMPAGGGLDLATIGCGRAGGARGRGRVLTRKLPTSRGMSVDATNQRPRPLTPPPPSSPPVLAGGLSAAWPRAACGSASTTWTTRHRRSWSSSRAAGSRCRPRCAPKKTWRPCRVPPSRCC